MVRPAHALNRLVLAAAAGLLLLPAGCIGLSKHRRGEDGKPVPAGPPPAEMLVTWNKSVQFGTNPVNNSPMAAVTASVFLFPKIEKDGERNEKSGHAIEANDGKMIVELFDDSATGQPAKLLERWELTPDAIKKYLRHDAMLGAYYGVALPWPSYTPDISRIHMTLRYQPSAGQPLTDVSAPITLMPAYSPKLARDTNVSRPSGVVQVGN